MRLAGPSWKALCATVREPTSELAEFLIHWVFQFAVNGNKAVHFMPFLGVNTKATVMTFEPIRYVEEERLVVGLFSAPSV